MTFQAILPAEVLGVEVEVEHGRGGPVEAVGVGGEALEEIPSTLEVCFERGEQQTLPEASRTAQEDVLSLPQEGLYILLSIINI